MQKILGISLVALLATIMLAGSVFATTGTATVYCTQPSDCTQTILILENKDASWVAKTGDGISATLTFGTVGPTFKGTLTTTGLTGNYALIYKPDTANRFVDWNGAGGIVLATWNGNTAGLAIDKNLVNLPIAADWNINPTPDYCNNANGFDSYAHCAGAKIWIVPTSDLTSGPVLPLTVWNPTTYLFETDLVTYTMGSPTTACESSQCVAARCGISATGDPSFSSMVQGTTSQSGQTTIVTNTGNVQVTPKISGANWVGSQWIAKDDGYWMPVGATQWSLPTPSWNTLTTTPTSIGTLSPLGTATVYYQLTVPSPQPTDSYTQTITFSASC